LHPSVLNKFSGSPDHYSDQTVRRWRHIKNPERHRDRGGN